MLFKMKKLLSFLTCLALFAACDSSPEQKHLPETSVSFGVMSDTHIGAPALASLTPESRLEKAYKTFTSYNPALDAIITVGDFTDNGTSEEFNTYKRIMDEFSNARLNLLSMGNHDNKNVDGKDAEDRFFEVFGFEATKDTVINSYHFITISTKDEKFNTTTLAEHREWLEGRLAAANTEDPHKPIFVFHHHTMIKTGITGYKQAQADPDYDLYDILQKYPQVVTFSGHSHVSFVDPRNIWQGDYTALNCGSVLYTALDNSHHLTKGMTHNSLAGITVSNRGESSTALIVEVKGTKVTVRRIDMYWDVEIPTTFVFDTSVNKANFPYREEKRIEESSAPAFAPGTQIIFENITGNGFEYTFRQAVNTSANIPDDGAFVYGVSIKNATTGAVVETARLQANYFMLPRPAAITHKTSKQLAAETRYEISITPIGYFGKEGTPVTGTVTTGEEDT